MINPTPEQVRKMEKVLHGLRYAAQVNQEQDGSAVSWAEVEAICGEALKAEVYEEAAEAEPRPRQLPPSCCGTCRHWMASHAAIGICSANQTGGIRTTGLVTLDMQICTKFQGK